MLISLQNNISSVREKRWIRKRKEIKTYNIKF